MTQTHSRLVLVLFLQIAFAFAAPPKPTPDELGAIRSLQAEPWRIRGVIESPGERGPVRQYFINLYADPGAIRDALLAINVPIAFTRHLIAETGRWVSSGKLPAEAGEKVAYARALITAFRHPSGEIRDRGFAAFQKRVLPFLNQDERTSLNRTLGQYQNNAAAAPAATAGLMLMESTEATVGRLRELRAAKNARAFVVQTSLEALAVEEQNHKRNNAQVQELVADFLNWSSDGVVGAASKVLADQRESVLSEGNRLFAPAIGKVSEVARDFRLPDANRIAALDILGRNREHTFFEEGSNQADGPMNAAIVFSLAAAHAEVRIAAADAFVRIKPPDEASQAALVAAMAADAHPTVRLNAFKALGGHHKHQGDHRIASERIKTQVAAYLTHPPINTRRFEWSETRERIIALLKRNPPRSAEAYHAALEGFGAETNDTLRLQLIDVLNDCKSFAADSEGAPGRFALARYLLTAEAKVAPHFDRGLALLKLTPDEIARWLTEFADAPRALALLADEIAARSLPRARALLGDPRAVEALEKMLGNPQIPRSRAALLRAFARPELARALPPEILRAAHANRASAHDDVTAAAQALLTPFLLEGSRLAKRLPVDCRALFAK